MDITTLGILPVGAITVICFLIGMTAKASPLNDKWIPIICGTSGGLLGVLWLVLGWPGYPGSEPITAAAIGIVSGLAATGTHQVYKQLTEGE